MPGGEIETRMAGAARCEAKGAMIRADVNRIASLGRGDVAGVWQADFARMPRGGAGLWHLKELRIVAFREHRHTRVPPALAVSTRFRASRVRHCPCSAGEPPNVPSNEPPKRCALRITIPFPRAFFLLPLAVIGALLLATLPSVALP